MKSNFLPPYRESGPVLPQPLSTPVSLFINLDSPLLIVMGGMSEIYDGDRSDKIYQLDSLDGNWVESNEMSPMGHASAYFTAAVYEF